MFDRPSASQVSGGRKRTRDRETNGNPMIPVSSISIRSPSRRITLRVRSRTRLNSGSLSRTSVHQAQTSGREAGNRFVTLSSTHAESVSGTKRPRRQAVVGDKLAGDQGQARRAPSLNPARQRVLLASQSSSMRHSRSGWDSRVPREADIDFSLDVAPLFGTP